MKLQSLLQIAIAAAEAASKEILDVYHSVDFQVETKGDQSPLTIADKRAHRAIVTLLDQTNIPILSEEGKHTPYEVRKNWDYFWLVDPLDGTKEFIKRNGEFTVNIALIHQQRPVLGVVMVPVNGDIYAAAEGLGAFLIREGHQSQLPRRTPVDRSTSGIRVVASRSHTNQETDDFIARLHEPKLVSVGSSLKFLLIAENKADLYPRFGPTMEWDTAAAHAIVNEVNLQVRQPNGDAFLYNKPDLLNPFFIVS